jgi:AGZA family xanthine/uracil permease-like MFS transporter
LDKFFKISSRNSTVTTEVLGGVATFLTMAYIIFVNPQILEAAGVPTAGAITATCLGAAIMTIAMGIFANRPLALASGMGINAVVAFTLVLTEGVDWRVAMSVIFLEGIIILILVLCGLREAIMNAIPVDLRRAIGIGIGLFIALIGLEGAKIVVADDSTVLTLGDLSDPVAIVGIIAIVLTIALHVLNVKGSLLWSILLATVAGIPLGVTQVPTSLFSLDLDFSTFFAPFQQVDGTMAIIQVLTTPLLLLFVFTILMSDFFDTMGGIVAVGQKADFVDKEGNVKDVKPILLVDSAAAAAGGLIGASSITIYVESAAGASEGARTGFSSIIVGLLFLIFLFFIPIIGMVSSAATCGALVLVGYMMMTDVGQINWKDVGSAIPAFLIIAGIPLTYSITSGIGLGFIAYVIIKVTQRKPKEVAPLMWIAFAAFLISFIMGAVL